MAESSVLEPPPAAPAARPPSELEIRRRVERLLTRELTDPSEELVRFVSVRLEVVTATAAEAEQVAEMCRRALREVARERLHQAKAPWRSLERHHLDRRRVERATLPGYYLG